MAVRAHHAIAYPTRHPGIRPLREGILPNAMQEMGEVPQTRPLTLVPPEYRAERLPRPEQTPHSPPHPLIEAPRGAGLVHAYLIDGQDERRVAVHKLLSSRPNMAVRAYRTREAFIEDAALLDEGCIILSGEVGKEADGWASDALLSFIRQIRLDGRFACILLTGEGHMRLAIDAMKAGAVDCLLMPCAPDAILGTLEDALKMVRATRAMNDASAVAREQIGRLTARERDVLHGLLHGQSNKMIALDLGISPRTVEIYRAHLMDKLGTHSLSETLKIAFMAGMA